VSRRLPAAAVPLGAIVLGVPVAVAPESTVAHVSYTAGFVAMVGLAWLGIRSRAGQAALAQACVAGALTVWLAGDLLYDALTWKYGELGPISVADYLWISGYPLLAAGLFGMTRLRAAGRLQNGLLDATTMATAVAAVVWQLMILPAFEENGFSFAVLVSAFYPFGDVILFSAVALLVLSPGDRGGPTRYLVAALSLTLIGDAAISIVQVIIPAFDAGRLDALLLLANSLLVAALWHKRADQLTRPHREDRRRLHPARLVFLGVALAVLPTMAILRNPGTVSERGILLALTVVLSATVLVRFTHLVRDHEQARAALAHRATHDQLTGLVNRQELHARLDAALRQRTGRLGPVVHFLDLDGFKPVNDAYGHATGDRVLVEVAKRLAATARPGDTVARLGGDEFIVLCEELETVGDAEQVAARLAAAVAAPMPGMPADVRVGASVGTAYAGLLHAPTGDDLLAAADLAMYEAKTQSETTVPESRARSAAHTTR
jgi:diguanylate cyclase (GGDEF)-like protein